MPTARPNHFEIASGARLLFGRADAGSIVAGVWTPGKDGSGRNTDASWNSLPLDQFVRTSGTSFQQIHTQLLSGGYDITSPSMNFGNSRNVANTFRDWSAPAMNLAAGKIWQGPSAGHWDSTFQGIIEGDLERMGGGTGWTVEAMPVIFTQFPSSASVPDSATYRLNTAANFTLWAPAASAPSAEVAFAWFDCIPNKATGTFLAPTGRHLYGGWYYDSARNHLVFTRISMTRYDLTTRQWISRVRPLVGSVEAPIDDLGFGYGAYCAATDRFVGNLPSSRTSPNPQDNLGYYQGDVATRISLDSLGSPVVANQNQAWTAISEDVQLAIANGGGGVVYGTLDIRLLTRPSGEAKPIVNGMPSEKDHHAICFVPQRADGRWAGGKVLRRLNDNSGTWRIIDWATKTESAWTPAGLPPPFAAQPGGWMFLYTRHDGQSFVIYISAVDDTSDAFYVMRVGS